MCYAETSFDVMTSDQRLTTYSQTMRHPRASEVVVGTPLWKINGV